jgi:hypothetical protein
MEDTYKLLRVILIAAILIVIGAFAMKSCAQSVHESRTFKAREHIAPAALVFVSGAFEGVMDHLQFHYDKPDQFWNPDISWKNKYKGGDPANGMTFAGKYMVWTTDGWHMMKFGRNLTMFAGFTLKVTTGTRKKWYWYVVDGVSYWAINRAGFNLTYHILK